MRLIDNEGTDNDSTDSEKSDDGRNTEEEGEDRRSLGLVISAASRKLSEYIRNSGDRGLYMICRLVCRNWARQFPLNEPVGCEIEEDTSRYTHKDGLRVMVQEGGVRFYLQDEWEVQPNELWAWRLVRRSDEWWMRIWVPKVNSL